MSVASSFTLQPRWEAIKRNSFISMKHARCGSLKHIFKFGHHHMMHDPNIEVLNFEKKLWLFSCFSPFLCFWVKTTFYAPHTTFKHRVSMAILLLPHSQVGKLIHTEESHTDTNTPKTQTHTQKHIENIRNG